MKVNILTKHRVGGPKIWGRDLVAMLNESCIDASHICRLKNLLTSPFYQDADIVHTTVPICYKLWRTPVVLTLHGDYIAEGHVSGSDNISNMVYNILQRLYPLAVKKADVITTPSQYLKERLGLDEAVVIPNAIFPERFKSVEHAEKTAINLVTVTKFYFKDKADGIVDIIAILDRVQRNTDKNINYTVIGGGHYLEKVKEKAKDFCVDVKFTGMIPNPKDFLERSDIFTYYSYHDNSPIVILEAMACGLPVITNNVGAVSEEIENGKDGFIAESNEGYIEYLLDMIEVCKERQKIGGNARKSIEEKFNWHTIVKRYIEIYGDLLEDSDNCICLPPRSRRALR